VAIINEAFAAAMPRGQGVVGARFTREATPRSPETTFDIVGIVKNSKYEDLKEPDGPVATYAETQRPQGGFARLVVRSRLSPSAITAAMTGTLAGIDPRIGVTYSVLSTDIRDTVLRDRLLAMLSAGFGALAALLTVVGLYGLVAYTVTRRTNEIGVRIALGATPQDIARLMVRETGGLLLGGVAVGVLLALAGGRTAATLLFGVRPYDPATLTAAVAMLTLIAFAASYAPARRATRIPPVTALRAE
jgi:ABC-type antimicrobial peptide transport system permease subunit